MRCFFHLVNGQETILDDTGVEVPDLETAQAQALNAISELQRESSETAEDWSGWRLDIVTSDGDLLWSIPLVRVIH